MRIECGSTVDRFVTSLFCFWFWLLIVVWRRTGVIIENNVCIWIKDLNAEKLNLVADMTLKKIYQVIIIFVEWKIYQHFIQIYDINLQSDALQTLCISKNVSLLGMERNSRKTRKYCSDWSFLGNLIKIASASKNY